jgi:hypothetical protein
MAFGNRLINTGGIPPFKAGVDGQYIAVSDTSGNVYVSNDFGSKFYLTTTMPRAVGHTMYVSKTGQYIWARSAESNSYAYLSSDFGLTFAFWRTNVFQFITSWDCNYVAVKPYNAVSFEVYNNYGGTFVGEAAQPYFGYNTLGSFNHDGQYCYTTKTGSGGLIDDYCFRNNNYGNAANWQVLDLIGSRTITAQYCNKTGQYVYTQDIFARTFRSTDYGVNFTQVASVQPYGSIACSVNGDKVATSSGGTVYVSTNYATNFTDKGFTGCGLLSMSNSGQYIAVIKDSNSVIVSTDYGATFSTTSVASDIVGLGMARQ